MPSPKSANLYHFTNFNFFLCSPNNFSAIRFISLFFIFEYILLSCYDILSKYLKSANYITAIQCEG